jgi:RNA polymerase sigma-70 factor (ECF subfamily)
VNLGVARREGLRSAQYTGATANVDRDAQLSSQATALETLSSADERALIDRARVGDDEAWRELYGSCYDPIYHYILARVGDAAVAEDLAADVFVAAVRGIESYSGTRPFLAWLFGIARHIASDHGRRRGRANRIFVPFWRSTDSDADPAELVPSGARPEDEVVVERLDLAAAMNQLREPQREVLTLRYFAGLTTAQIGAVMHRDVAAVYSLHARALLALRKVMAETAASSDEFRPPRATTN